MTAETRPGILRQISQPGLPRNGTHGLDTQNSLLTEQDRPKKLTTPYEIREFVLANGQSIEEGTRSAKLIQVLALLGNTGIVVSGHALKEYFCPPDTHRHLSTYMKAAQPSLEKRGLKYINIIPRQNQPAEYIVESVVPLKRVDSEESGTQPAHNPSARDKANFNRSKIGGHDSKTYTNSEPYLGDHRREALWNTVTEAVIGHSIARTLSEIPRYALIIAYQLKDALPEKQKPLKILAGTGISKEETRKKAAYEIVSRIATSNLNPTFKRRIIKDACVHFNVPIPGQAAALWNVETIPSKRAYRIDEKSKKQDEERQKVSDTIEDVYSCACCRKDIPFFRPAKASRQKAFIYVDKIYIPRDGICSHPDEIHLQLKEPVPQPSDETREGHHNGERKKTQTPHREPKNILSQKRERLPAGSLVFEDKSIRSAGLTRELIEMMIELYNSNSAVDSRTLKELLDSDVPLGHFLSYVHSRLKELGLQLINLSPTPTYNAIYTAGKI